MDRLTKDHTSIIQHKIRTSNREILDNKVSMYLAHKLMAEIDGVPLLWTIKLKAINSFKSWILEKN